MREYAVITGLSRFRTWAVLAAGWLVAHPALAQDRFDAGSADGLVSATRLTYLALASLVVWVVVFALVFAIYKSQKNLTIRNTFRIS